MGDKYDNPDMGPGHAKNLKARFEKMAQENKKVQVSKKRALTGFYKGTMTHVAPGDRGKDITEEGPPPDLDMDFMGGSEGLGAEPGPRASMRSALTSGSNASLDMGTFEDEMPSERSRAESGMSMRSDMTVQSNASMSSGASNTSRYSTASMASSTTVRSNASMASGASAASKYSSASDRSAYSERSAYSNASQPSTGSSQGSRSRRDSRGSRGSKSSKGSNSS